jgi:hypothetical protein
VCVQIKEKLCFVSCDTTLDQHLANETTVLNKEYKLPDGQRISIGGSIRGAPPSVSLLFSDCILYTSARN